VRRLEDAAGRPLLVRDTHSVALTDAGEAMAGFARSILAAHEEATTYFTSPGLAARLRFGAADDLALAQLPGVLRTFRQLHPWVQLELTVGQTSGLRRRLDAGQLDLVLVKEAPGTTTGTVVRRDPLVWVGLPGTRLAPDQPVPLVAYSAPSLSRVTATRVLADAGRSWRITCKVLEVNGVLAAVRAGLGIAAYPASLVPGDLQVIAAGPDLPALGDVDITLLANPLAEHEPVEALRTAILRQDAAR
jgi:DNA-binding transcriptional LysR family regulator